MDSGFVARTTLEAVRCMFMARVMEQKGDLEAAQRWWEAAGPWMQRKGGAPSAGLLDIVESPASPCSGDSLTDSAGR